MLFAFNPDQFNGWVQSRASEWCSLAGVWDGEVGDAGREGSGAAGPLSVSTVAMELPH